MPTNPHLLSVPHYRVVSQGPFEPSWRPPWTTGLPDGDVIRLRALYSSMRGHPTSNAMWRRSLSKWRPVREYEIGAGVRELPAGAVANTPGQVIVTGRQNKRDGEIGLGLFYNPQAFAPASSCRRRRAATMLSFYGKSSQQAGQSQWIMLSRARGAEAASRISASFSRM